MRKVQFAPLIQRKLIDRLKLARMRRLIVGTVTIFVVLMTTMFVGCADSQLPPYVNYNYVGYGNTTNWTWAINGNTSFLGVETTTNTNISGLFARDFGGFVRLMLVNASGTQAPPNTSIKPGLEIPGASLFVVPVIQGVENQLVTNVVSGSCPAGDFTGNYIYTQFSAGDNLNSNTRDYFGVFNWSQANQTITLSSQWSLYGPYQKLPNPPVTYAGNCVGGVITYSNGQVFLSNNGYAVMKPNSTGATAQDVFFVAPNTPLVTQNTGLAGPSYSGFLYDSQDPQQQIRYIQGYWDAAWNEMDVNTVSVNDFMTFDGLRPQEEFVFDTIDDPAPGFMQAHIEGIQGYFMCTGVVNAFFSTSNLIVCVGQSRYDITKPAAFVVQSHN
jgi:hypothetical protein